MQTYDTNNSTIFDFIKTQESAYKLPIPINETWDWNMYEHIRLTVLYKNSRYSDGKSQENRPFKNILRAILNTQYRTEGFDVKDIEIFINDSKKYFKSLLVRKFHDKWARENSIDTFIDELVESYCDFGGALVKRVKGVRPEVVPLQSIAFCDQTDILSGPIAIKHFYSPDQLTEMESKGWGKTENNATSTIDQVIVLSREEKKMEKDGRLIKTPGKYIEVYEIHGTFPKTFLDKKAKATEFSNQFHIVCYYQKQDQKDKSGVTLFSAEEKESIFKFIKRDPVFGRALGFGGAEELFESQVWTNYNEIRMKELLDAASKVVHL